MPEKMFENCCCSYFYTGVSGLPKTGNNTTLHRNLRESNNDINNRAVYNGDNLYLVTPLGDLLSSPYAVTENGCYELYNNNVSGIICMNKVY